MAMIAIAIANKMSIFEDIISVPYSFYVSRERITFQADLVLPLSLQLIGHLPKLFTFLS